MARKSIPIFEISDGITHGGTSRARVASEATESR